MQRQSATAVLSILILTAGCLTTLAIRPRAQSPFAAQDPAETHSGQVEFLVRMVSVREAKFLRASPLDASARLIPCHGCSARRTESLVELRASSSDVIAGQSSGTASVTLVGAWRICSDSGRIVNSSERAVLTAELDHVDLTLAVPEEEYVARVLASEASNFRSDEALKAMAVAVRTYAVRFRGRHHTQGFDFCDSTHCQALRLGSVPPRFHAAAQSTAGQLLWYGGSPASTYYFLDCGGTTEAAGQDWPERSTPYLVAHADPYCVLHGRADWTASLTHDEITQALAELKIQTPAAWSAITIVSHRPSGRVRLLKISGATRLLISASRFRLAVNRAMGEKIRSDLYEVSEREGQFVFHGYGAGHGIGLCQKGADVMGISGKTYREILAFYYPGTILGTTSPEADATHQISQSISKR